MERAVRACVERNPRAFQSKVATQPAVGSDKKVFKNPIDFYAKGRTFEVLRKIDDENPGIAVKGSKGDVYHVNVVNGEYTCSCVGFKYHGTCKHIMKVKDERNSS